MREKLYQADRTNPGRQATFVYARATLAESQAKHSDDSGARATLTKAQIVLSQLKPELRDQLDMISAEMGINGVSARLDGRAAASNGNAASRVALCQSAETALQRVRMRQPQWEEFHKQSLQPEIDEIRAEMKGCVR